MTGNDTIECNNCGFTMEELPARYNTRIKPTKTYQCPNAECKRRVLEFNAYPRPFKVSSTKFVQTIHFSDVIEAFAKKKGFTIIPPSC